MPQSPFRLALRTLLGASALFAVTSAFAATRVQCLTESINDVEMAAPVAGSVAAIRHGEGEFVDAGAVILELESRAEQLEVERRTVEVDTLKGELDRSESLLKSTSSISREEVDKKRGEYRVAAVQLDLARDALAKRKIVAPFPGVVTLLPVKVGEYCQPPKTLVRLVDARQFYAVANVEPKAAAQVTVGATVQLEAGDEGKLEVFDGKVVFISPVVDPASGLLRLKAVFANPDGRLRPGVAGRLVLP